MIVRAARRPARRGISLMEVLLALAIFLISLVAIARLVDMGADRAADTVFETAGTRLAQSKLAEVEAGVVPASTGGSGTFDEEPEWQWAVEPAAAAVPNVYPVTVRVWRDVRGTKYEVSLSQMICDPLQMGTAAEAVSPDAATTDGTTSTGGTSSTATTGGGS